MHTHELRDENGQAWIAIVNGDFSGDVKWSVRPEQVVHRPAEERWSIPDSFDVTIPFSVIKDLVGRQLQSEAVAAIEDVDGGEYLDRLSRGLLPAPR